MDTLLQSLSPIGRSASGPARTASSMVKESILVIEDEDDIAELVHYNLEREGYRVQLARDGESGLKEAIARLPNLVVLDLMLPEIDGMEVCRRLLSDPRCREIPIIISGLGWAAKSASRQPWITSGRREISRKERTSTTAFSPR